MTPIEFRQYRIQALGLSQKELSDRINLTRETISRIESGHVPISTSVEMKIKDLVEKRTRLDVLEMPTELDSLLDKFSALEARVAALEGGSKGIWIEKGGQS